MDAEKLYQDIYEQILNGELPPGKKIHITKLANQFGVGIGSIREVLSRLTATELVIAKSQKGFIAAPLSIEDMEDLYTTRTYIEELALTLSIQKGDTHWEAAIIAAFHQLDQIEKKTTIDSIDSYKTWEQYHRGFNEALLSACGLQHLVTIQKRIYQQTERYRRIWFSAGLSKAKPLEFSLKQKAILDAALAHDSKKAIDLLQKHFDRAKQLIAKKLK